jgi:hypothetical protein
VSDSPQYLIEQALLAMQAAFASAQLYAQEHAAVRAHEARAHDALELVLKDRERASIVLLENKVLFEDLPLASGPRLIEGRARAAASERRRARHILPRHRSRRDPRAAHHDRRWGRHAPCRARAGTSTSALSRGSRALPALIREPAPMSGSCSTSSPSGPHWNPIERAWTQFGAGGDQSQQSIEALSETVSSLCALVGTSRSSILPLAQLKRHDEYTFVHTYNVSMMSAGTLGGGAGLPADMVHDIGLAAMMHDLGKQLVPLDVLNKPGALSESELQVMRRHPVDGAKMLLENAEAPPVAVAVAFEHHMNIDGTGYPPRPKHWRVSLSSQIVHIADVFDALQTHRPYRRAMPLEEAISIMRRGAGQWYEAGPFELFYPARRHPNGDRPAKCGATSRRVNRRIARYARCHGDLSAQDRALRVQLC